jgi:hypothetical protein
MAEAHALFDKDAGLIYVYHTQRYFDSCPFGADAEDLAIGTLRHYLSSLYITRWGNIHSTSISALPHIHISHVFSPSNNKPINL